MKLIKPVTFLESQLISTSATETVSAYVAGTSYAIGDKVEYGVRLYESLVAANLGNQPDISPTKWLDYAPDNKHAMFDNQVNTQTIQASPLTVVVKPGVSINSAAFLNLDGASLNVTMDDGLAGPEVYNETISLDDTIILDWYMYFFEPFDFRTEVILTDLPAYTNGVITMTLTGSGNVKIGSFVYGTIYTIGGTQNGVSVGIKDYSVKTTDEFGNTTFVPRAFSRRMDAEIYMDNTKLNYNYRLLSDIRSTPVVWIGSDATALRPLVQFGYYRDFTISIPYVNYSLCSISIEGLV